MKPFRITADSQLAVRPGDFGMVVDAEKSTVRAPTIVAELLISDGIFYTDALFSYVSNFPSAYTEDLNWTTEQAKLAINKLAEQLSGYVNDLTPAPRDKLLGGANPPPKWKFPRFHLN